MGKNTGVKLNEIMEIELLNDSNILAGEKGLENLVKSVNVMEVPDIENWIQEGEFILTTAYSIKDDVDSLNTLIPIMHNIGVAGIAIKTNRYIGTLPKSVIDTANTLNFPIIQIPMHVTFGDLIADILTIIVNRQTKFLRDMDFLSNKLKEAMLKGGELEEIAEVLYSFLGVPVAVSNDIFKEFTFISSKDDNYLEKIVKDNIYKRVEYSYKTRYEKVENCNIVTIPIYNENTFYGNVLIIVVDKSLDMSVVSVVEASVSLVALSIAKKISLYENENKHRTEFLDSLLSSRESDKLKAMERHMFFGFRKDKCYCCVVARIKSNDMPLQLTPNNSKVLEYFSNKLLSCINRVNNIYKGKFIYGNKSDRVVFLVEFDRDITQTNMRSKVDVFAEEFHKAAISENIADDMYIGIGRGYSDYRLLDKSYKEAIQVIHKLGINREGKNFMHFSDLGIYKILSNEAIRSELLQFSRETLSQLLKYDKNKDSDFIETLRVYFQCNGNLRKVAEELFTHYNTIIYRINRIKEISDIDLDDHQTALNVQLSIRILDFLG